MEKSLNYKGVAISYQTMGDGPAIIFLHGYLESSQVWGTFLNRFIKLYRVIAIDLPGHGKSEILGPVHTMSEMAAVVNAILIEEQVQQCVLFGHSMGGYVVMEFAHEYRDKLRGYGLIHSTCFADSEEKRENRDREIALIRCGKKNQVIHTNIPKSFADFNLEKMEKEVLCVKEMALSFSDEGTIALLQGMKKRADHSATLKKMPPSPLIVYGKSDNYISEDIFQKMVGMVPQATAVLLKNSGHMGFLEEPDCLFSGIVGYLSSLQ